jgi:hypothetical protein
MVAPEMGRDYSTGATSLSRTGARCARKRAYPVMARGVLCDTGMRWLLLLLLAACDSGSAPASNPDLAMCSTYQAPTCCPGVCAEDACCDPACLSALEGGACTPGLSCTYDQPNVLEGTFTCDANGKLQCASGSCLRADLGF